MSILAARFQDRTYRLEWIAIVTHGNSRALVDLRDGIAPCGDWVGRVAVEWPDISIDDYQKEGIERREDGGANQKVRMYYLWPAMWRLVRDREERVGEMA